MATGRSALIVRLSVAIIAISGVVVIVYQAMSTPRGALTAVRPTHPSLGPVMPLSGEPAMPAGAYPTSVGPGARANDAQALSESHNYWQFAHSVLADAKKGDPDAEYYLAKVLSYCDSVDKRWRGQVSTVDQAAQWGLRRHLPYDVVQLEYERCHDFLGQSDPALGTASDWMNRATEARQPNAEADTATALFVRQRMADLQASAHVIVSEEPSGIDTQWTPRQLLRDAVTSGDPEVLFEIGENQLLLNPGTEDDPVERDAWLLVACERGYDCSGSGDWIKSTCDYDPSCYAITGPTDFIRRLSGDNWPEVQARAQDIGAKLDAGRWDELGLGP